MFTLGMPQGLVIVEGEHIAECTNSAAAIAINGFVESIPHLTLPMIGHRDHADLLPGTFDLATDFVPSNEVGLLTRLVSGWIEVGGIAIRPDAIRQPIPLVPVQQSIRYNSRQSTLF